MTRAAADPGRTTDDTEHTERSVCSVWSVVGLGGP